MKSRVALALMLVIVPFVALLAGPGAASAAVGLGPWQTISALPDQRGDTAAVRVGDYMYVIGGVLNEGAALGVPQDSVYYATVNGSGMLSAWQTTTPLPTARQGASAVAHNGYIYVVGGAYYGLSNSVFRAYVNSDGSLGSWTEMTPTTMGHFRNGAVVAGAYLYAIGSADLDTPGGMSRIERAPIASGGTLGTWEEVSPLPTGGVESAVTATASHVYVLGGEVPIGQIWGSSAAVQTAPINDDGSIGPWRLLDPLPEARHMASALVADGFLYLIGGNGCTSDGCSTLNTVIRARILPDGSLENWSATSSMNKARALFSTLQTSDYVYALGGGDVERAAILPADTVGPIAQALTINGGALGTVSRDVLLEAQVSDATDPPADLRVSLSHDGETWSSWAPYAASMPFQLPDGDGLKTVYARFKDPVENLSAVISKSITLDTRVPSDYGVSINDGALFTNRVAVALALGARPRTAKMQISNDGGFAGATWEPYTTHRAWSITAYGNYVIPRVAYVRYRGIDGVTSAVYQDDILLDVMPPHGTIRMTLGALGQEESPIRRTSLAGPRADLMPRAFLPVISSNFCPSAGPANVTLTLAATDDVSGVSAMQVSNYADFSCATWEPYATTMRRAVGSGVVTVYARFRDAAGNISAPASDTITVPALTARNTITSTWSSSERELPQSRGANLQGQDSGLGPACY